MAWRIARKGKICSAEEDTVTLSRDEDTRKFTNTSLPLDENSVLMKESISGYFLGYKRLDEFSSPPFGQI